MTLQFVYFTANGLQLEVVFPKVNVFQEFDIKKLSNFLFLKIILCLHFYENFCNIQTLKLKLVL